MRPRSACMVCRTRRRRCLVEGGPDQPCTYCKKGNFHCSLTLYASFEPTQAEPRAVVQTTEPNEPILPPGSVCQDLIEIYFKYIHDTCHWIFHRHSIMEAFRLQELPAGFLFGMISIAARFSNHSFFAAVEPRKRGQVYAQAAAKLLDLTNICIESMQLCHLLGSFYSTEGDAPSENIYYSAACRMAALLKTSNFNSQLTHAIDRESMVRVLWSLKMADVWTSNACHVPRMLPPVPATYPIPEVEFQQLRRTNITASPSTIFASDRVSIVANIIQLNSVLDRVAAFLTASVDENDFTIMLDNVDSLDAQLDSWYATLDPRLKDTPENLNRRAQEGDAHIFVSMYLGYYHYGQILHYQYLHNDCFKDDSTTVSMASKCKNHAAALCDLLYRAYETPGAEVYYAMVGHVLMIASTIQIHTLMFDGDEANIKAARTRLEKNYQILSDLVCFWPLLEVSMTRLQEFHNACLKSRESTFRMDRWMVRFLFEFAARLGEKPADQVDVIWPQALLSPFAEFSPSTLNSWTDDNVTLQLSSDL